jgi:hypothetical protein
MSEANERPWGDDDLDAAQKAIVADLRGQIMERVRGQQQLVLLAPAVAGAIASFAGTHLTSHPSVLALVSLLFTSLSLALLRYDQEIAIIATHLTDERRLGADARAQRLWEYRKKEEMQGTKTTFAMSAAQAIGIYGMPILGAFVFAAAALRSSPDDWTWAVLGIDVLLLAILAAAAQNVFKRYRSLYQRPTPLPDMPD